MTKKTIEKTTNINNNNRCTKVWYIGPAYKTKNSRRQQGKSQQLHNQNVNLASRTTTTTTNRGKNQKWTVLIGQFFYFKICITPCTKKLYFSPFLENEPFGVLKRGKWLYFRKLGKNFSLETYIIYIIEKIKI